MAPPPARGARVVPADPAHIVEAARLLRAGRLVAFPTETVYGLGAVATNDGAIAALFAAKARPADNPLIVHLADASGAGPLARMDSRARLLAERFWPGPLTLVLPRKEGSPLSPLVTAGLDTVALRVPCAPIARALLEAVMLPVAAPSANPSGRLSPTTAEHVALALGDRVALVLDGGPAPVGVESTVLDLSGPVPRLLRPGAVTREAIEAVIGVVAGPLPGHAAGPLRSPGQMASHYAPTRPVRLQAGLVRPDEALLAFGPRPLEGARHTLNLSPTGDLDEAARNLFAMLHALDREDVRAIAVMPIPEEGLGEAINDRLRRAAAPRPRD
jgi:L-threonylcarbamoyladenylate synthase